LAALSDGGEWKLREDRKRPKSFCEMPVEMLQRPKKMVASTLENPFFT